jgi:hypothetical protein
MDLSIITTKIKEHIEKHKVAYLCALTGVGVAGITFLIMKEFRTDIRGVSGCPEKEPTDSFSFISNRSMFGSVSNNIVTTIHKQNRGNPGYITKCLDTGELFETQGDAARIMGVSKNVLSAHLNGKFPDVDGLHFERLGVLSS